MVADTAAGFPRARTGTSVDGYLPRDLRRKESMLLDEKCQFRRNHGLPRWVGRPQFSQNLARRKVELRGVEVPNRLDEAVLQEVRVQATVTRIDDKRLRC